MLSQQETNIEEKKIFLKSAFCKAMYTKKKPFKQVLCQIHI